jgi:hypothetical protein
MLLSQSALATRVYGKLLSQYIWATGFAGGYFLSLLLPPGFTGSYFLSLSELLVLLEATFSVFFNHQVLRGATFSVYLSYWFWKLLSQCALATRFYSAPGLINQKEKTGLPLDDNKKWDWWRIMPPGLMAHINNYSSLTHQFFKMEPNLFTIGCIV